MRQPEGSELVVAQPQEHATACDLAASRQCTCSALPPVSPPHHTIPRPQPQASVLCAPVVALRQQVVEKAYEVQPHACDRGGEEDGRQAVGMHVPRTRQHIVTGAHLEAGSGVGG